MSDRELYEIARKRVDAQRRRWTIWAIDLGLLILSLGALILFGNSSYSTYFVAAFFGMIALFVPHTIYTAFAEARTGEIENEVAKLRKAMIYEKPKRLELSDDGELVDINETERENVKRSY